MDYTQLTLYHTYSKDELSEMQFVAQASCQCQRIKFGVLGNPLDSKYCHCRICQRMHGAPFQWAVIFRKEDVRFLSGQEHLEFFSHEHNLPGYRLPCKMRCRDCGSILADEGERTFIAMMPVFNWGYPAHEHIPAAFLPSCHIFYAMRLMDIKDALPKWSEHKNKSSLI